MLQLAYQRCLKRAVFLQERTAPGPWLCSPYSLVEPAFLPIYAIHTVSPHWSEATLLLSHLDMVLGCSAAVLFLPITICSLASADLGKEQADNSLGSEHTCACDEKKDREADGKNDSWELECSTLELFVICYVAISPAATMLSFGKGTTKSMLF